MIFLQVLAFFLGAALVLATLNSAIKTFVLPRGVNDLISKLVFRTMLKLFRAYAGRYDQYERRDGIMALFSPVTLLILALSWMALIEVGYTLMYMGIGETLDEAFKMSGSSLLTLGFATVTTLPQELLAFSEAALGLIMVALLISYLPTMYAAFAKREAAVTMLAVRAGEPPSASELLIRYNRITGFNQLTTLWQQWELWFAEIEESHTSLASLVFFRSPQSDHSWVTAAGTVLDAAALRSAAVDQPRDPQAELMIRAGYLALGRIATYFGLHYPDKPTFPETPISISKGEFLQACAAMAESGVPIKADRDQAWLDYAGWRVNYDAALLGLALLTMAPYAPWTSDRSLPNQRLPDNLRLGPQVSKG